MESYDLEMVLFGIFEIHLVEKYTPKIATYMPTGGAAKLIMYYKNYQLKMTREIISFFTHNVENYELNLIRAIGSI